MNPSIEVTIPLNDLIELILGTEVSGVSCREVPSAVGYTINPFTENSPYIVIFHTPEGNFLQKPILWRRADWLISVDRWKRQKQKSEEERIARFIYQANHKNLSLALIKTQNLTEEYAARMASRLLDSKAPMEVLEFMGLSKLITKEDEL